MQSAETLVTNRYIMGEINMMWFDETKIMMEWKRQWTRMYSVAVGIRPYGQLEERDGENMLSEMHFWTEQQRVTLTAETQSQKVSQNSSLLMDSYVFVHVSPSMIYIIHSGKGKRKTTSRVKGHCCWLQIQLASMLSPAGVRHDLIYKKGASTTHLSAMCWCTLLT